MSVKRPATIIHNKLAVVDSNFTSGAAAWRTRPNITSSLILAL